MKRLKWEFFLLWGCAVVYTVLHEIGVMPEGTLADDGQVTYILGTIGVLLTLMLVYMAIKLFTMKGVKDKIRRGGETAFCRWSETRLSMLAVVVFYNLAIYYATLQNLGALCTLIGLAALLFVYPSKKEYESILSEPE